MKFVPQLNIAGIDSDLAKLLSDFFLDISKAWFIASLVTPEILPSRSLEEALVKLVRGLGNAVFAFYISWRFSKEVAI